MKIVFFGNTKYSVFALEIIHSKVPASLVVTIPDRPSGRGRELKPNPVKIFAKNHKISTLETDKLDAPTVAKIAKLKPDFLIVADYGLILPNSLLLIPRFAPLNIHHSLLPKYRGPAPAPAAILAGEKVSGVTIIYMTEIVDAGDILTQKEYTLKPDETTDSLLTTLNKLGGELAIQVLEDYLQGKEKPKKQNDKQATYTKRLTKQVGYIDVNNLPDPQTFDRMVRAYYPWPTVWTRLTTHHSKLITIKFLPGNLIQPEGKRPMTTKEFLNGYPQIFKSINVLFGEYLA